MISLAYGTALIQKYWIHVAVVALLAISLGFAINGWARWTTWEVTFTKTDEGAYDSSFDHQYSAWSALSTHGLVAEVPESENTKIKIKKDTSTPEFTTTNVFVKLLKEDDADIVPSQVLVDTDVITITLPTENVDGQDVAVQPHKVHLIWTE